MPTKISLPELPARIQKLLEERQQHADAVARIDQTLASIGAALSAAAEPVKTPSPVVAASSPTRKQRRRGRGGYATSAEESILGFVKHNKNPTTADIKKHWAGEGRASTADNTLSKMVKEKKLKRTPIGEGVRGSRYSLI